MGRNWNEVIGIHEELLVSGGHDIKSTKSGYPGPVKTSPRTGPGTSPGTGAGTGPEEPAPGCDRTGLFLQYVELQTSLDRSRAPVPGTVSEDGLVCRTVIWAQAGPCGN